MQPPQLYRSGRGAPRPSEPGRARPRACSDREGSDLCGRLDTHQLAGVEVEVAAPTEVNRSEQAIVAVVLEAYVNGVSTRKVDRLVE